MNSFPAVSIIGPGKMGTAIGILASRAGYPVAAVGGRDKESVIQAALRIGKDARPCMIAEAAKLADIIFITVSDDAIESVCTEISNQKGFNRNSIVIHCSGALCSEILSSARDACQCLVASMHPLQTFPTVDSAVEKLKGAYCFYEGDEKALPAIEKFAERIGLMPVKISGSLKIFHHIAAVFACNYLVALMDATMKLAKLAQIDPSIAWSAYEPLVLSTIKNITEMGTAQALTGPIARGDIQTITGHIEKLASVDPSLTSVYNMMGCHTVDVAERKGSITKEKAKEIRNLLGFPK